MIRTSSTFGFIWFEGVVEDRKDPLMLGRVRVRVIGLHTDDKGEIPTEELHWAQVMMPVTSAAMNGINETNALVEGTHVVGYFRDGTNYQDPVVMGSVQGIPLETANAGKGFYDPREDFSAGVVPGRLQTITMKDDGSGTEFVEEDPRPSYPRSEFLDEPDVNRLARNEKIEDTIVQDKKDKREIGQTSIPTAAHKLAVAPSTSDSSISAEEWDEPENPYDATYPYNKVLETESGHIIEYDDTPGAERIHFYHRTGSFHEWHPDGSFVQKVVNDRHSIIMRDDYEHVEGKKWLTIDKGAKIFVNKDGESGNDAVLEIGENGNLSITIDKGNCNLYVDGDCNKYVSGDVHEQIGGSVYRNVGNGVIETIGGGGISRSVAGNVTTSIGGSEVRSISGTQTVVATLIFLN